MISAVVVFHSELERLSESVESLRGQAQEIIVIDVSPFSETLGLPAQRDVTYHQRPANLGYGWACNIGIAASANEVVLISNPDVVYSQDALARLAEVATLGHLCGPVQFRGQDQDRGIDEAESLQLGISKAASLNRWLGVGRKKFVDNRLAMLLCQDSVITLSSSAMTLSGAALMATKETWKRLGGFDERYFLFQEDADLCVRAQAMGVPVSLVRAAWMAHRSGSSRQGLDVRVNRWAMQSERRAWQAHQLPTGWLTAIQLTGVSARMVMSLAHGRFHDTSTWARTLGKAITS